MNRFIGRLVSGIGGALVLSLVLMTSPAAAAPAASVAAPSQVRSAASPAQVATWQRAAAQGLSLMTTARALERYLVRQPNGTLSLKAPAKVISRLPANEVQTLLGSLALVNKKIAAGELRTTTAGSVYDPKADQLTLQGGWTGYGSTWYSMYYCFSHAALMSLGNYPNYVYAAAVMTVIAVIPGVNGLVAVFVALYWAWLAWADHGNGSCLNVSRLGGPMWVTSQ